MSLKTKQFYRFSTFFLLIYIKTITCLFDPYTIISVGTGLTSYIIDNSYCLVNECCNPKGIPANFSHLEAELKQNLYGQHLVIENVVNALRSHWDEKTPPKKALAMSFHGGSGTGKNYVAEFIKKALFERGSESTFVHHYNALVNFPRLGNVPEYKRKLYEEIKSYVEKCRKQLFIFDAVDLMPAGVLDVLKPLIDYNENVEHVNYRETIFIFISNTGSERIASHFFKLWEDGIDRADIALKDFEQLILKGAFNEIGGLHHSNNIKNNLIDLYIPFLPMELKHVRLCILKEFKRRNVVDPEEKFINETMEVVDFWPAHDPLYAKTGCKRISGRVGIIVTKNNL